MTVTSDSVPAMGTVRRLAAAAGDVTLGQAAEAYLVTLGGAEQASTRRTYGRILRRVVAEFGAETAPDEVDAERFAEWFGSQWAGRAPSTWNVSLDAVRSAAAYWQRQGWLAADFSRMLVRRRPRPDRDRALSRGEVDQLLTRKDISLRERTLWRMLYETAARSAEVLALDVEDLDLPNRARQGPPQGRRPRHHRLADRYSAAAAAPAQGPQDGPGVRDRAEGPCAAPRGRPGRARTRQAQLPAGRGTVRQGLRRRNPAPAQALRADSRRRGRNRDTDAHEAIRPYVGQVPGQVRASERRGADATPGRARPSAETVRGNRPGAAPVAQIANPLAVLGRVLVRSTSPARGES